MWTAFARIAAASIVIATLTACSLVQREPPSLFVVYFPARTSELTPDARKVIEQAADAIRTTHPVSVAIAAGIPVGDNLKLGEPRYAAVRDALVADGVDAGLLARASVPEDKKDVGGTGNQRVEIRLLRHQGGS